MFTLENIIKHNIAAHALLRPDRPVIVGVSGGADSLALLAALHALGYECIAVHCNYHLRGQESNRDMRHTQAICASLGIDLYVRDFDVDARRRDTGESVEMACRELRYQWMHDLLDRRRAQAIAVAHHQEDNVETFLLNLLRGSSIAGLTGMRWHHGYVVRPLLNATRAEIEQYLAARGIPFVVDSTNAQCEYARNRLRNIVLPLLDEQFPGAARGILESIRLLGENREFYDHAIAQCRERYLRDGMILLQQLIAEQPQAALVLYELIKPLGFNMTHARNILASANASGLHFFSPSTTLELDRGLLSIHATPSTPYSLPSTLYNLPPDLGLSRRTTSTLYPLPSTLGAAAPDLGLSRRSPSTLYPLPSTLGAAAPSTLGAAAPSTLGLQAECRAVADFRPDRDPMVAYFDESVLQGNPRFTLRHWQRGDRMQPFGMTGTKLVSDIFADAKYTAAQKRDAWLLLRNDQILWIIGLRPSALFTITPETTRYITLRAMYRES